jgi:hypothetical protein
MLNNGDKLVVTKTIASFLKEGDIVEVRSISEDGVISFAFGDGFMHMGVMNTAECENHFKKVEEEEEALAITEEYINEIMEHSEFDVHTVFDKCTVVTCRLPNGFVITESSACVRAEDYDEEIGTEICVDKIASKVWELEAYRLQQHLWEESFMNECNPSCTCDCEECICDECDEEEFDEAFDEYEDDCDDCEDFDCPYHHNNCH